MDLPKNVTQIGETDAHCKVYVEDYVVSYLKQLNAVAVDKEMAVALYGVRREEENAEYLFLYGACRVNFLQKETRHLSQAQQQEIERLRKKYFRQYTFLAYRLLNGELIEGFHVCERGISRYVSGYAQFYEKNDSMLAYMLEVREEVAPEAVEQDKYEAVKKRQEARRALSEEKKQEQKTAASKARRMRGAAAAVFAALCIVGLTATNGQISWTWLRDRAESLVENVMSRQLPDVVEVGNIYPQVDTLVAEDKLAEALRQENEEAQMQALEAQEDAQGEEAGENATQEAEPADTVVQGTAEGEQPAQDAQTDEAAQAGTAPAGDLPEADAQVEPAQTADMEPFDSGNVQTDGAVAEEVQTGSEGNLSGQASEAQEAGQEVKLTAYTIRPGDTLIGISVRNYGSDAMVEEICEMNRIVDPNDIKVGEKILLP